MDRLIDPRELHQQKTTRVLITVLVLVSILVLGFAFGSWIRPSAKSSDLRFAQVEFGPVEAAVLCSGTVLPEMQQIVPCPFSSRVLEVFEEAGARVEEGQALVRLDDTELRLEVRRLQDQLALKKNQRHELILDFESGVLELEGEIEIQTERLAFFVIKTEQQQSLRDLGLTSIHELRQAELDEKIARIELRQLRESMTKKRQSTATQTKGIDIEIGLLVRDHEDRISRLERATVRADRAGVLTSIISQEGANLPEGEVIARVADLSRFRIEATVSDLHVGRFSPGMLVRVVANDTTLTGRIENIPPAITNGVMGLNIVLDNPAHKTLRANLRVDVHVITETRSKTLRVQKGPFINGAGEYDVFVVRGKNADRVKARFGVSGIDFYEVLSGLSEGDEVIISNMSEYLHLEKLKIR